MDNSQAQEHSHLADISCVCLNFIVWVWGFFIKNTTFNALRSTKSRPGKLHSLTTLRISSPLFVMSTCDF